MKNAITEKYLRRFIIIILLVLLALMSVYFIGVALSDSPYDGLSMIENMSEKSDVCFTDDKNNLTLEFSNSDGRFYLTDNGDNTTFSLKTMRGFGSLYVLFYESDDDMKFTGSMYISSDGRSIKIIYDSWKYKKSHFNLMTDRS